MQERRSLKNLRRQSWKTEVWRLCLPQGTQVRPLQNCQNVPAPHGPFPHPLHKLLAWCLRWETRLLPVRMEPFTGEQPRHSPFLIKTVLWHEETLDLFISWDLSKFSSRRMGKITTVNWLEGKIKIKHKVAYLLTLYEMRSFNALITQFPITYSLCGLRSAKCFRDA